MQALPSEKMANEGARALKKVNLKAKLRDQYLEGKGVDASQALAEARRLRRRTSAPRTPTRHGCSLSSPWKCRHSALWSWMTPKRRQDSHLIVQHLLRLRDQLLVPPPGRRFLVLPQGLMQLLLLPHRGPFGGGRAGSSEPPPRCTLTLISWHSRTFNASSSASMDRISCRMSTRLLSGTTSAMVISSAVSVFGGALPRTVPSTRLRSACARVPPGPAAPRLPPSAAGSRSACPPQ